MIYVVSDIHGCYEKFLKMVTKIGLKKTDKLYVLGDVVDRGSDSMELIFDLAGRENVRTLMGNHDYMAALMLRSFAMPDSSLNEKQRKAKKKLEAGKDLFQLWLEDGGYETWSSFLKLSFSKKTAVLNFLESLPIFARVERGGKTFLLSHTVPEKKVMLQEDRPDSNGFLFGKPEYDKVYFEDRILVTGHTPTGLIEKSSAGRIWKKNNHIAIDCGAVFGNPLGCICLETGEEFYVE